MSTDRSVVVKILGYVGMILTLLFVGVPLLWIVLTSFKTQGEIYTQPVQWLPDTFTFANYQQVFRDVPFGKYFANSIIITVVLCTIKIVLGVISAYALAILRFPGRDLIFMIIIATLMVPAEVTVISNYAIVSQMGWRDTYVGVILPLAGIAFGTFLMRNHFMSIPNELIEAARMDHCGHFQLLWKVLLPISMPTLVAFSMITIVNEWNQYLWPLLIAETSNTAPLPIGLTMLQNNEGVSNWGPVMAATIMTMLPILVLFLALQQYMIKGLISGAVKG
ncbi:carbohydrate ABC transporter permease [Corynebacterium uterequi]|uniref:Carbohydrate ABC transporter membrane protein 2, CUT1 family n=1 Tax=Corynebacterium uterequi TaxID=1072256 RepID=A0A0G3HEM0_9CORY|nr:carbohydrate ABC transporter permease [Corynebacterium uterequi]AKK11791.1 carbohydrate ABC transporter membrane protein 2, CUT1 family [Corynebacterium uterequi]